MQKKEFRKNVHARQRSDMGCIKARIKHAEAFKEWKAQYINRFYYARVAPPGLRLLFQRQKKKEREAWAKCERAANSATKKLKKHKELVVSQNEKCGFDLEAEDNKRYHDFLPPGGKERKAYLMYQWKDQVQPSLASE